MTDFIWGLIAGSLSVFLSRKLFTINTSMDMMKYIECLFLIAASEIEGWRNQALYILELSYKDTDKEEEFIKIKDKINERYRDIQIQMVKRIFHLLPIKKKYTTVSVGVHQNREYIASINKFMEKKNDSRKP